MTEQTSKKLRGFAAMSPEKRRAIAAKGGGAVPAEKRSFSRSTELATTAGRKGGEVSRGGSRPVVAEGAR